MATPQELIGFLRNKSAYIKTQFLTYKKIKNGIEERISYCNHQIDSNGPNLKDVSLSIFFSKNENPEEDFKKHKKDITRENKCKLIAKSYDWKMEVQLSVVYVCEVFMTESNFFKLRILDAFI